MIDTAFDPPSTDTRPADDAAQISFDCPTCGAADQTGDECRRCKCNLTWVRSVRNDLLQLRHQCLAHLRARRLRRATQLAQQCCQLAGTPANQQLLATCYLMQGDFATAFRVAPIVETAT